MNFYPDRPLINHRGKQLNAQLNEGEASVPLTLGALAVEALLRELPQDNNAPGKTKIARYKLAKEIHKNCIGKEDHKMILSLEDLNLVKTRIDTFPAMIVGPANEALEEDDNVQPIKKSKSGAV